MGRVKVRVRPNHKIQSLTTPTQIKKKSNSIQMKARQRNRAHAQTNIQMLCKVLCERRGGERSLEGEAVRDSIFSACTFAKQ